MARVETIFTAEAASEPMVRHNSIGVVEGGLAGDRYQRGTGHYSPFDVCAVTFISQAAIETIRARYDIDLSDGRHRRNIVVSGVDLRELLETTFQIGDAVFRGTRPRPPCAHVEAVANEDGVARALSEGRGGICADVVEHGSIAVGDQVEIVEADPRTVGRAIADRLGESNENRTS